MVVPPTALRGIFPEGHEKILVVDDEISLRRLLETAFVAKGYTVATAANGLEAIDYVSRTEQPLDAVLLDLNMPGASGLEVAKVIKIARPDLKVLMLSGNLPSDIRAELQNLGIKDFVQKPYALDDVGRRLRALLDQIA